MKKIKEVYIVTSDNSDSLGMVESKNNISGIFLSKIMAKLCKEKEIKLYGSWITNIKIKKYKIKG